MPLTRKQLAERRSGIGGSEVAVIAGLSQWSSPIKVWESKVLNVDVEPTDAMDLGNWMEDPVAKLYAKRTGRPLAKCGTLRHPTYPHAFATPDRLVLPSTMKHLRNVQPSSAERLLEVKTSTWRLAHLWGEEGTDEVPMDYLCQVTWQMSCAGVTRTDVAVLFDGRELKIYTLDFDAEFAGMLHEMVEKWWTDYVDPKRPPPPDGSPEWSAYLKRNFARETEPQLVPVFDDPEHLPEYRDRLARIRFCAEALRDVERGLTQVQTVRERLVQELKEFIGEREGIAGPFGTLVWKANKPSRSVNWEGAARKAMEIARDLLTNGFDPQRLTVALTELSELESAFTSTKPGIRPLRKNWNKEATDAPRPELPDLTLPTMPSLDAGPKEMA